MFEYKKHTYPEPEAITVTESSAEVKFSSLVHHTFSRLCERQADVINSLDLENVNFRVKVKVGSDGTSGVSAYKMTSTSEIREKSIYLSNIVPLELKAILKDHSTKLVWKNPRPSSTKFCRPIKFEFIKEDKETTLKEYKHIKQQFENVPDLIINNDKIKQPITVRFHKEDFYYTMVDGKVANVLTDTASNASCRICNCSSKEMNNLQIIVTKPINDEAIMFGLSPLHARIRFMELVLHVSYRNHKDLRCFNKRMTAEQKNTENLRKESIRSRFKSEMALDVDKVTAGGAGSSNDGNTSRRMFKDLEKTADITGFNYAILEKFGIILDVINSTFPINQTKFKELCDETAQLYVEKYPWYPMPASVHIILLHGPRFLENFSNITFGELSEEAQEARNKDMKKFRTDHTRKTSRHACNTDLFHMLLTSSDPIIAAINYEKAHNRYRKATPIRKDVLTYLLPHNPDEHTLCNSSDEDVSDDDS